MKRSGSGIIACLGACLFTASCSLLPPRTAEDIVSRSVKAHGGQKLSAWRTLSLTGTVEMEDGIGYKAAYRVQVSLPGKLRVEQDLTADRGRAFYEYFLNDGTAWSRRNLVPGRADVKRLQRWLNQCYGIAYYASHAKSMSLEPEGSVEWRSRDGSEGSPWKLVDTTPAYVVKVVTDEGVTAQLSFDKKRFYLLQEATPDVRRVFRDFQTFEGVVWPKRIIEVTRSQRGEVFTPYEYRDVKYNVPIDDWVFAEDMPAKGK